MAKKRMILDGRQRFQPGRQPRWPVQLSEEEIDRIIESVLRFEDVEPDTLVAFTEAVRLNPEVAARFERAIAEHKATQSG